MLWRTYDRLKTSGFAGWNYENHIPVLVSKERILHCWSYYGYGEGSLIWKTAYFNMFPLVAPRALLEKSRQAVGATPHMEISLSRTTFNSLNGSSDREPEQ